MFLNKKKAILVISICLIFYPLTYNDVKSQEINIITGTAIVADGDSIKINNKTPKTIDEIPKTVLKKQIQLKQKIKGKRNLPKF